MRLTNNLALPDSLVREILRFVCPPGVAGYDVYLGLTNRSAFKGKAYHEGSSYHATAAPFVKLYIGAARRFPRGPRPPLRSKYLPTPWLASRTEALVYLAAHELRHLWQGKHPRGGRVWGARGQFSERDADAYAIRKLREWRRTR